MLKLGNTISSNLLRTGMIALMAVGLASTAVQAAPVDLSSWTAEGQGTWNLQPGNDAVKQTVNGDPTVFFNGVNSQGNALSGTIEVQTGSDDDFVGFVLGYNAGDLGNSAADYLLIDWKQTDQNFGGHGFAPAGLAISSVTGVLGDNSGAWAHDPTNNVTELQRATNLGSTGWADNTSYTFDLTYTASLVEVFVNGVKELSISGTFANGSFGFYNYSQAQVLYAGITEDVLPVSGVPVPAALPLFGTGLAIMGFVGWRRKRKLAA